MSAPLDGAQNYRQGLTSTWSTRVVSYEKTFEWLDFPEGRIRYAGGRRGRDEPPITTFSVELSGKTYFGEFRRCFLPDGNNYDIEVISFGWRQHDWPGTEPHPKYCAAFTPEEIGHVQSLICQAVTVWRSLKDRPSIVREYSDSRFSGEVAFRDGWALVRDVEGDV